MSLKVVLAMSGGVDSSVCGQLLKSKGHYVIGVYMHNWINDEHDSTACNAEREWNDVKYVCRKLDIPSYRMNFAREYWIDVFEPCIREYSAGVTPNPDVLCNSRIKFGHFYDKVFNKKWKEFGYERPDKIATGHYVSMSNGRLYRGVDPSKDQSYFLCRTGKEKLENCIFPVGNMIKTNVKQIARDLGLNEIARKKESSGVCFVDQGKRDFGTFLSSYLDDAWGPLVDIDSGKSIGYHSGIHKYTIGQRVKDTAINKRLYVVQKDSETNIIYVTEDRQHVKLNPKEISLRKIKWINECPGKITHVKIRHMGDLIATEKVQYISDTLRICLKDACFAPASGQIVALYSGDECLGGGLL